MRTSYLLLSLLTFASCADNGPKPVVVEPTPPGPSAQAPAPVSPEEMDSNVVELHSLEGSGLDFNGVYDSHTNGNIHYFMRFFRRGNVALVAGRQEPDDPINIASYLTQDVKSGKNNVHNVPVTLRKDSIFFITMATRGAITYACKLDGDTLRCFKHSKATGKKAEVDYAFIPDGR